METKTKMTQCEKILAFMQKFGKISSRDAMNEFGCMRLASRIHDLKRLGYNIESETVTDRNKFGEPVSFKVYWLVEGGN